MWLTTPLDWEGCAGLVAWAVALVVCLALRALVSKLSRATDTPEEAGCRGSRRTPQVSGPATPAFGSCEEGLEAEIVETQPQWGLGECTPPIPDAPLHALLLRKHGTSHAPALWLEGSQDPITYADLLGAARSVALELRCAFDTAIATGSMSGECPKVVPVVMLNGDGYEVLVGVLGSMMARAMFSSIDVEVLPKCRLQSILDTTEAPTVLVSMKSQRILCDLERPPSMLVVHKRKRLQNEDATDWLADMCQGAIDDVMALFWTSGSTGLPKGVMVSHRAALSHYAWYMKEFDVGPGVNVLRATGISFDLTFSVVLGALLHGACVVWPISPVLQQPPSLIRVCREHCVSFVVLVPTVLSLLLEEHQFPSCVLNLGCGGEQLHWTLVARLQESLRAPALHNRYGPTECGNISTIFRGVHLNMPRYPSVPIGRPCPHRGLHLVSTEEAGSSCAWGELWLTGPGLADGYFARQDLTDKAFQALPGNSIGPEGLHGQRAYKTGDLVRWTAESDLLFLGRVDFQIKIRGQRIEMGEIEAVLKLFPGCTEVAVVPTGTGPGIDVSLIAFVSPSSLDFSALAKFMSAQLPRHMVPSSLQPVNTWPRNSNGKIDRKVLEAQARTASDTGIHVQTHDSLGNMRLLRSQVSAHEMVVYLNLRFVLVVQVHGQHLWIFGNFLKKVPVWDSVDRWPFALYCPYALNHTAMLFLCVGYMDAKDISPYKLNRRDAIIAVVWLLERLYYRGIHWDSHWWMPLFLIMRVVTRCAWLLGNWRIAVYLGAMVSIEALVFWIRRTPVALPIHVPWWLQAPGPSFYFTMYWLGLEYEQRIKSWAAQHHFGLACHYRIVWGCVFAVLYVLIALFEDSEGYWGSMVECIFHWGAHLGIQLFGLATLAMAVALLRSTLFQGIVLWTLMGIFFPDGEVYELVRFKPCFLNWLYCSLDKAPTNFWVNCIWPLVFWASAYMRVAVLGSLGELLGTLAHLLMALASPLLSSVLPAACSLVATAKSAALNIVGNLSWRSRGSSGLVAPGSSGDGPVQIEMPERGAGSWQSGALPLYASSSGPTCVAG